MAKKGVRMRSSFYKNIFFNFVDTIMCKTNKNEFLLTICSLNLYNILLFLKNSSIFLFKILGDICVIDNPLYEKRFSLVYQLLSVKYNNRIFIKTTSCSYIKSVVSLFKGAN